MMTLSHPGRSKTIFLTSTRTALVAALVLFSGNATAAEFPDPTPVVRGFPPAAGAPVVALCPDISERPEVFLARAEASLATRLARSGYRVYLVDPWAANETRVNGFDGAVTSVYPRLVQRLAELGGTDEITWIGHGLCGYLPVAAAAKPNEKLPSVRWVALGTRLGWRMPAPTHEAWLESWSKDESPVPRAVQEVFFTGVRDAVGPRASSVPSPLDDGTGRSADEILESYHRNHLGRTPTPSLVEDLRRWYEAGTALSASGWLDYQVGIERVAGPGLVLLGASDPVAPPEDGLQARHRFLPGTEVDFEVLSRVEGRREEYGHLGMLLSNHAARDVDRLILGWLRNGGDTR